MNETAAVLDACPDVQWRVMVSLARFGGLRTPSETLRLRWADIDWANNRFTVTSPKTEHHDGHGSRLVPLFPELFPHLREAFEQAQVGAEYDITQYRPGANVGPHFTRIVKRAGLKPWPKLWQNLRATRATELAQQFPQHVATAWLGHSAKIAEAHYLHVTAEHFTAASQPTEPEQGGLIDDQNTNSGARHDAADSESLENYHAKPSLRVAQNPTQQAPARGRMEPRSAKKNRTQTLRTALGYGEVARPGVEVVGGGGDQKFRNGGGLREGESGKEDVGADGGADIDDEAWIAALIEAGRAVPPSERRRVLGLVRAAGMVTIEGGDA